MTTQVEPAVVDLPLPQLDDFVVVRTERELTAYFNLGHEEVSPEFVLPLGSEIHLKIITSVRARWTGTEWLYEVRVGGNPDPLWVRATVKSNEWSEVDSL